MIADQDLRDAARACEKAILESLPGTEGDSDRFSPAFERSMRRLIFRVDHPVLFWLSRLLPLLLLLGLIAAGTLLSGRQPSARSASSAPAASPAPSSRAEAPPEILVYRPTWLPEGCELDRELLYDTEGMIVYRTPGGAEAVFLYSTRGDPAEGTDLEQGVQVPVGDCPGVLILGRSKGELNDLFWSDADGGAGFWLSAPYPEDVLIQIAESVEPQRAE